LKKGVSDLQEEVEVFGRVPFLRVGVLQTVAPVFLDIEALVFNFPSDSYSLLGDSRGGL
jgi:hypothetical protein